MITNTTFLMFFFYKTLTLSEKTSTTQYHLLPLLLFGALFTTIYMFLHLFGHDGSSTSTTTNIKQEQK